MKTICVFLGSSDGNHPSYMEAAAAMGRKIAERGLTLVYGGSSTGMMNQLANSALLSGGEVIGVTVQTLKDRENYHTGLTRLHVMPTMHERKNLMVELSDGFIALPGGIGTFEEFFEVYTLQQMGFNKKPCGLLDVNGFYEPLYSLLDTAMGEGFLRRPYGDFILRSDTSEELIDRMMEWELPS